MDVISRRELLRRGTVGLGLVAGGGALLARLEAFAAPGSFADELVRTPRQTEGPFYPNKLSLDTDYELVIVNATITPDDCDVTHLSGRILDTKGDPLRNTLVEIWQCDANG